jgi:hypothetical protein
LGFGLINGVRVTTRKIINTRLAIRKRILAANKGGTPPERNRPATKVPPQMTDTEVNCKYNRKPGVVVIDVS